MNYLFLVIGIFLGMWIDKMLQKDNLHHSSLYYLYKAMFCNYVNFNIVDRIKCSLAIVSFNRTYCPTIEINHTVNSIVDVTLLNKHKPEDELYGTVYEVLQIPRGLTYLCYYVDFSRWRKE